MACCVIALAMVYRLIDAWRRARAWVAGVPVAASRAWRAPALRRAAVLAVLVELGFFAGFGWQHRAHLSEFGGRMLVASSGLAANLCRPSPPVHLRTSLEE
ncbi:MAG TPA: hypothetical protein PJ986_16280 [Gammaproteobacteria bacterium]|nr:hypothetical protein [Gammaproteobacteria bacterium]